ncbi:pyridoxal phosphate-dependent decarboxylase family protein [Solicola gregarius]|uniref:Aminotransferase class V-fold PLP-dependent enzyme n=1 Tax=Solicola gregarius TaxID=2908642 RepID=A0AA46YNL6_9ACTN|nr:aminotransferase class V-fold PLP-dependent enzyme [Solicola gregarius]UYM06808.1 aminotransferase class V-fold PLP-dependent enzyme [Solicola gregarius]
MTILERLQAMRAGDVPTHGGRTLAYVYDSGLRDADAIGREALSMYASSNGLDPTAFPSLLAMENELIDLAAGLLDAPDTAVGTVTSGGTESILLAVQAARDARTDVRKPNVVMATSAHAAFHKACHYFGVERHMVDVDPSTMRADADAMAAAIDSDTVLVVASAPSYAHGVVDPVRPIAQAAKAAGVRCHVDACIGGWVLPYLDEPPAGPWTFAVGGVTSISVDLHKYAYTPKGVSLLLHRDPELRRPQFFASADWPGYTMLNSTTQSTKSGGPLAAAWAVVQHIGSDGYAQLARDARSGVDELIAGIATIEHLSLIAAPDSTLLAVETDDACDVFTIADEMLDQGWYVQPQLSFRGMRPSLHLSLSAATAPHVPQFLTALGKAVDAAVASGPIEVASELVEAAQAIDPATLDDAAFDGLLQIAGLGGDGTVGMPERMAPVNALLDAAPPALREALLVAYLDRLTRR